MENQVILRAESHLKEESEIPLQDNAQSFLMGFLSS